MGVRSAVVHFTLIFGSRLVIKIGPKFGPDLPDITIPQKTKSRTPEFWLSGLLRWDLVGCQPGQQGRETGARRQVPGGVVNL